MTWLVVIAVVWGGSLLYVAACLYAASMDRKQQKEATMPCHTYIFRIELNEWDSQRVVEDLNRCRLIVGSISPN